MYKNFNLTESEKKQILNMHKDSGYKKPLNESGMFWLTKIKIDSPEEMSQEEKFETAKRFESTFNGRVAVEFSPNEWYDGRGRINDIDKYEEYINNHVYGDMRKQPGAGEFEKKVRQNRRDPDLEGPHDEKHQSFGDYVKKSFVKKSLGEQNDSEDETPNLDNLVVEDHIYAPVVYFTVYVSFDPEHDQVPVVVSHKKNGEPVFNLDPIYLPEGGTSEMFINAVKQKMGENPFNELKYNGAVINYETGETENY